MRCLLAMVVLFGAHTHAHAHAPGYLVAAVFSPMKRERGQPLDLDVVEAQAASLRAQGVSRVLVAGTTGESVALTQEERKQLAYAWVQHSDFTVYVQVGSESTLQSYQLAQHAESIGAHYIVSMMPSFFAPPTIQALLETLDYISSGAPTLPFFYYHIPGKTGETFRMLDVLKAHSKSDLLRQLVGIKFSAYDLLDFAECCRFQGGRYTMLYGSDELLTAALLNGASGAVGSTYNFNGLAMNKLLVEWAAGNYTAAQQIQRVEQDLILLIKDSPGVDVTKAMEEIITGVNVGPPRLPTQPLSQVQMETLRKQIEEILKDSGKLLNE